VDVLEVPADAGHHHVPRAELRRRVPGLRAPGPFSAVATIEVPDSGERLKWADEEYSVPENATLRLRIDKPYPRVIVELRLDGTLVYRNELKTPDASQPV